MRLCPVYIVGLFSVYTFQYATSATIDDAENLHSNITQNYNKNVRPIYDQNQAVAVTVALFMTSIQEFDEVKETFSFTAGIQLSWSDYRIQWDPSAYGGLERTTFSYKDVWVPELILSSPSSEAATIGKTTDRIRFHHSGFTEWLASSLIESTCSVNVRNYPFDTQNCTTTFTSLGYKDYEVNLTMASSTIYFTVFSPNSLWDVIGSETGKNVITSGSESELLFSVTLKRKSAFVVINVVMPILVLSLLNGLVFVLVPESGERIGYCITTLLAIAVYMTIVSDTLPRTSEPVPLISYNLMVGLLFSALIVLVTILNLRLHHRADTTPVPGWIQSVYTCLCCARCRYGKVGREDDDVFIFNSKVSPVSNNIPLKTKRNTYRNEGSASNTRRPAIIDKIEGPITWKKISYMIDVIALTTFTLLSLLNFFIFIGLSMS